MLSYQHIYHAGNPADVHKHALLCWMLDYMTAKTKPMSYIETHAGRGLYDLGAAEAVKTGEAQAGIGRLEAGFAPGHPYIRALEAVRAQHGATSYGGSPKLAAAILRPGDAMHLAELHPQEYAALAAAMGRRATLYRQDGIEMALSICPPEPRRGLMMIDPSWEVKAEYQTIPAAMVRLHRKWSVGVIALWYPILREARHAEMLHMLEAAFPQALRSEVAFAPVREGHGMTGSGMFVVNPPWGLQQEAALITARFG